MRRILAFVSARSDDPSIKNKIHPIENFIVYDRDPLHIHMYIWNLVGC